MSIFISSSDEKQTIEFFDSSIIHSDKRKIIALVNMSRVSQDHHEILDDDGLLVSGLLDSKVTKTKNHFITTSLCGPNGLRSGQYLIEFDI